MAAFDGNDMAAVHMEGSRFGGLSHFDTVQILALYQVAPPTMPFDNLTIVWPSAALTPL